MYLFYASALLELILVSFVIKIFIYNLYAFISRYVLWYLDDSIVYMRDLILAHIWLLDLCSYKSDVTTKLKERLNLVRADNFNELVNMAITQEDCISAHRAEKKRKTPTGPSTAQPTRYRLVQNPTIQAPPRNNLLGRWVARPPQQARFNRPPTPQSHQQ
jgi:hypothetical protein